VARTNVVIFVPGLLGSALRHRTLLFGNLLLWLGPTALLAGKFPYLALPLDDQPGLPPPNYGIQPGGPLGAIYGPFTNFLALRGWDVREIDMDWRHPVSLDAATLANYVRTAGATNPVAIVCHSRGGLVTRRALANLAATGEAGKIRCVVGMGVPHSGSLNAVINLSCQGSLKDRLRGLGRLFGRYVGHGLGLEDVYRVVRSWPSVYELLPAPGASWVDPAIVDALYLLQTWSDSPYPPYGPYLAAAKAAWQATPAPPPSLPWTDVVGYGIPTAIGMPTLSALADFGHLQWDESGDGTVPMTSAAVPGRRRVAVPCQHDMLTNDARAWPWIDDALRGALHEDVLVTGKRLLVG
jgi:hypothetical protein